MLGALSCLLDSMRKFVHLVEEERSAQGLTIACPITGQRRSEEEKEKSMYRKRRCNTVLVVVTVVVVVVVQAPRQQGFLFSSTAK